MAKLTRRNFMKFAAANGALLAAGEGGKRAGLPNSRVMIHQPMGGAQGQASDIQIQAQEILKTKHRLHEIIANHSGRTIEDIERDSDRDYWMSSEEAQEYGLIDNVLVKAAPPKKDD